jgi:tripartite-type tricarboxylate transporter receptor subunit TctC
MPSHKQVFFLAFCLLLSIPISAQTTKTSPEKWPSRPIRMIVPFAPGGLDVIARKVAIKLGEQLNVSVFIDNRAGANGIIGADLVAKSAPDGYTMLIMTGSFSANAVLYKKLPFDPMKDFAPITQIYKSYGMVMVANSDVPFNSVKELLDFAKANPNKLSYGSGGVGNASHLVGELFNILAPAQILHVPYKGLGPAFNEVLGKQIEITYVSTAMSAQHILAGRIKAFAISGDARAPIIPNVPTFNEAGVRGLDQVYGWAGLWFPANTPIDRIEKVQQALAVAIKIADLKKSFDDFGVNTIGSKPQDFEKFVGEDIELQRQLFKQANIQAQ